MLRTERTERRNKCKRKSECTVYTQVCSPHTFPVRFLLSSNLFENIAKTLQTHGTQSRWNISLFLSRAEPKIILIPIS